MKLILAILTLTSVAYADLQLDCSDQTPKQMKMSKPAPTEDPCASRATSLVAMMSNTTLYVCENGAIKEAYDIAIGRGGIGKKKDGDLKTPLGTYPLGQPHNSTRFGIFIPVGYPTAAQKAKGMTGHDVGIHGPDSIFPCAGVLNVSVNWTQGCLAVADDRFIVQIADFVKAHKSVQLHILD